MDGSRVVSVLQAFAGHDIPVWVDGGWCIDALLHRQTRSHDDLDLVARIEDTERIVEALGELGYVQGGGGIPHSYELVDAAGHQVDVHPVAIQPNAEGDYRSDSGVNWVYPAHAFSGRGRVDGRDVSTISADFMLVCHTTGYALDADHSRDVELLAATYDLQLPAFTVADPPSVA
jgi:lincosamide nucleotidyltransferase A/C/D/E